MHSYGYGPNFIHKHGPNIFSRIEVPGSIIMAEEPSAERLGAYRQDPIANRKLSVEEAEVEALEALGRGLTLPTVGFAVPILTR